jgi:hypothetical protein
MDWRMCLATEPKSGTIRCNSFFSHPYDTDPEVADTDGDGINDGEELSFWKDDWSSDVNGDGLINLLVWDSDDDGHLDGIEIKYQTDP